MQIIQNTIINGLHGRPMLADVFYEETKQAKPIVIFTHGFKGFKDWGAWDLVGKTFAKAGAVFLKYNLSHNGTSVEHPTDFVDLEAFGNNNYCIELDDLGRVIDWITTEQTLIPIEEIATEQIYLIGHSRGGGTTILKAYEDKRVKKLVTWASVQVHDRNWSADLLATWKEQGVVHIMNGRTKQQMPLYWQLAANFYDNTARLDIPTAVKNLQIPYLIVHGTADPAVNFSAATSLHAWNPATKLLPIENGSHVFGGSHPWKENHLPDDMKTVVEESITFLLC